MANFAISDMVRAVSDEVHGEILQTHFDQGARDFVNAGHDGGPRGSDRLNRRSEANSAWQAPAQQGGLQYVLPDQVVGEVQISLVTLSGVFQRSTLFISDRHKS